MEPRLAVARQHATAQLVEIDDRVGLSRAPQDLAHLLRQRRLARARSTGDEQRRRLGCHQNSLHHPTTPATPVAARCGPPGSRTPHLRRLISVGDVPVGSEARAAMCTDRPVREPRPPNGAHTVIHRPATWCSRCSCPARHDHRVVEERRTACPRRRSSSVLSRRWRTQVLKTHSSRLGSFHRAVALVHRSSAASRARRRATWPEAGSAMQWVWSPGTPRVGVPPMRRPTFTSAQSASRSRSPDVSSRRACEP